MANGVRKTDVQIISIYEPTMYTTQSEMGGVEFVARMVAWASASEVRAPQPMQYAALAAYLL